MKPTTVNREERKKQRSKTEEKKKRKVEKIMETKVGS